MPICITCSTPVKNLYTTYSKADDRSLGKGVRLTQCPNCKRFADKYVEHDYIVLFIDLVLIKPQVYRHLLFNRLGRTDDKLDPSILRLGILLILFDVYITWARIEQSNSPLYINKNSHKNTHNASIGEASTGISSASIMIQYLFFLTLNVVSTIAQHLTIRTLARLIVNRDHDSSFTSSLLPPTAKTTYSPNPSSVPSTSTNRESPSKHLLKRSPSSLLSKPDDNSTSNARVRSASASKHPGHFSPSSISTALLVSSCTKLFPILLVIWPTNSSASTSTSASSSSSLSSSSFTNRATSYISYIVLANNIEALYILLDCGYMVATFLAVAGVTARWIVEGWILSMGGLARDSSWIGGELWEGVVGLIGR